jgi:hypothetical protein
MFFNTALIGLLASVSLCLGLSAATRFTCGERNLNMYYIVQTNRGPLGSFRPNLQQTEILWCDSNGEPWLVQFCGIFGVTGSTDPPQCAPPNLQHTVLPL